MTQRPVSRRDALKTAGLAGAGALATSAVSSAQAADGTLIARNPYGGVPSGGITVPAYYRSTPYLVRNNFYYPGQEQIGPDEMRISFIGSTPRLVHSDPEHPLRLA
jgi:ribonuclease Z